MSIQLQNPERLVIYVSDMDRSTAFYRDTLGLPLKFTSPGWTEFNNEGTTLALHRHVGGAMQKAQPAAGQASLVFVVADLAGAYATLQAEGVEFAMPPQTQPSGMTFAIVNDPDGFGITLQQQRSA